jgi:catechol 2,3-dioxygenase-like lactoylglutathione lyase family enzyme
MKWKRTNPVYPVADVSASIEWYRAMFGLTAAHVNQAQNGANYAILAQDGAAILHLLRKDEAPHGLTAPVEAQFWIEGHVNDLFARLQALGARVVEPPANQPWGHRDFVVADPDSNLVWITAPLERASAVVDDGMDAELAAKRARELDP